MRRTASFYLLCLFFFSAFTGFSQINLLKKAREKVNLEKVKEVVKDKMSSELDNMRAEMDSTSFSYAISVNDNAEFADTDDFKEKSIKWLDNFSNRKDQDEQEKAKTLKDLGEVFYAKGHYRKAAVSFLRSQQIYEENNLTSDPNYTKVIANIGLLYSTMGRYTKAEEITLEALEKRKNEFGTSHISYAASLNNLAVLQKETGRYNQAEQNLREAIAIFENNKNEQPMPLAVGLNNQAMLYQAIGRFDEALSTLERAIDISEDLTGSRSNNHQKFLTNLALLHQEMQNYDQAESLFLKLIKIKENRFGSGSPDYAHMLSNLAALYAEMGQNEKVEEYLLEAIDIYKRKYGEDHRLYAGGISDLGNFYRYQQNYDKARPLIEEAKQIFQQQLGESHPEYVNALEDLAILDWKSGKWNDAIAQYKQAISTSLEFVLNYFPPMSEAEKTKYWDKLRPRFERFYSFAVDASQADESLLKDLYETHIATKGLLLSSSNKIKNKILASGDAGLIEQYQEWIDQKEMLARYYSYSKEELAEEKINLDSLENATNANEKLLSANSDVFNEGYSIKQVNFDEVQAILSSGEAAVELIRVRKYTHILTNQAKYIILTLKPGKEIPQLREIADGTQLETRFFKFYNNSIHQKLKDEFSYKEFWAPIAENIAGSNTIYLSSDGIYNQINPNTMATPSGSYVIDQYNLVFVGNTKELIKGKNGESKPKSAVLVGNPEFGGGALAQLPGTEKEVQSLNSLLKSKKLATKLYTGSEAKEDVLKQFNNPGIVHIATHGYFLQDEQLKKGKVFGISSESAKDNPLLRAGLLLSGSGRIVEGSEKTAMESSNNGILTAYEAINLTLDQTELVVLSACETGVGDVKAGEGVYGLQRAFLGAGADALVMSLWKVDDAATQELMTLFYTYWFSGNDKRNAFRKAQLKLKTKYPHPYYWGGFMLMEN